MALSSPDFAAGQPIPPQFTCSGENRSPQLDWSGAPAEATSFAIIAEDPDAPSGTFIHWVIFNLPGKDNSVRGNLPRTSSLPDGATQGTNSFGSVGYRGPCPPPGAPHHYHFVLYALDSSIDPNPEIDAKALRSAMSGHIKATTELVGTFSR